MDQRIAPGETFLMQAGASGLASVVIPMAKAFGIRTLTTVLDDRAAESIKDLGADRIIVTHPFFPVHMVPYFELCASAKTAPGVLDYAKEVLAAKGVEVKEYTGSNPSEVMLAADAIVADGMDAVFTPTDNTIMAAELSIYEKFADAKIPHYCGADSFALNGAFLGFGVDYANLGRETADMIAAILLDGAEPATLAVKTFDNGTATVNTETCEAVGFDFETIREAFGPFCTQVVEIQTAEAFE